MSLDGILGEPLEAELFLAACGLRWPAVRHLLELGVPRGFLGAVTAAGDVGFARVSVSRSGLFEFEGAEPRLIVAVRERGVLLDLVAIASGDRSTWALRTGAGVVLGADALIEAQVGLSDTVRLHGTPLDWLIFGGTGICVLDWSAEALGLLRGLGSGVTLACDDAAAAERLRGVLAHGGLPKVGVAGTVGLRRAA